MNEDMSEMLKNLSNAMNNPEMSDKMKTFLNTLTDASSNNKSTSNANDTQNNLYEHNNGYPKGTPHHANVKTQKNYTYTNNVQASSQNNFNNYSKKSDNTNNFSEPDNSSTTNNIFNNIDLNTILKIQQIMNAINDTQSDSRSNLLMSLKPYLKESRKKKIDQYIQLMKMEKIFETMNSLGGEK